MFASQEVQLLYLLKKSNDIFSSFRDAVSIICRIFVVAK